MKQITEEDAKEAGVNREVLQDWNDVMQGLWTSAIETFKRINDEKLFPAQGENEIIIGKRFKIDAIIVNGENVEVRLWEGETQLAEILYGAVSVTTICICVFKIILNLNETT